MASPVIVDEAVGMWLGFSLPGYCSLGNHVDIHLGKGDGDSSAVKGFFYGHKNLVANSEKVTIVEPHSQGEIDS